MTKPILCLDFDGVIHSYTSGWKGADVIPDPPVDGAIAFLYSAIEHFDVQIFSSRSNQDGGIDAMRAWLRVRANDFWVFDQLTTADEALRMEKHLLDTVKWPTEKPPAMVTIDDRVLTVTGGWPSIVKLLAFQPWNKKPLTTSPPASEA